MQYVQAFLSVHGAGGYTKHLKIIEKDFIAPSSFRFGDGRTFRMGRKLGAVSFLEILAPELNDRMLSDILDLENGIIVDVIIQFPL